MTIQQTEAAVLFAPQKPVRILSLKMPPLKPGQVLVELFYSGICHTQVGEVDGKRGPDAFLPHTLGHEGSGIVREIGPGVSKVKSGDPVVLSWIRGKGQNVPSAIYESSEGTINSGAISTFLKHAIVSENRLFPIPAQMPLKEAALLGCAIPTGAGIIFNTAKLKAGQTVAIFGLGGIGTSALLAAVSVKPKKIIAVDVVETKLEIAKKLGATETLNPLHENVAEKIHQIINGGVDLAIEAAGRRQSMETAFESIKAPGGLCVLAGNLPHGEKISVNPFDLIRGKRILGTWGGETDPDRDIPLYVEKFLNKTLNLQPMISQEYPLDQINQALQDIREGRVVRALLNLQSQNEKV